MSATTPTAGEQHLALDSIHVRANVRELDPDHVDALAQSIALRGLLVDMQLRVLGHLGALVPGQRAAQVRRERGRSPQRSRRGRPRLRGR